jgi:membrane protein implicated in regulation of membrane protease activity
VLQERTATQFGIAAIGVMAVLFVLVFFRLVPPAWEIPLFIFAVALFAVRLVLRSVLARRKRQAETPDDPV